MNVVEFDVETTGLQPWSDNCEAFLWIFSSEPDCSDAEAITYWPGDESEEGLEARDRIQWWFDKAKEIGAIRAHNAKFDRAFAESACDFDVPGDGMWHDSMLVAHVIDERRSVALKSIATQLFGDEAAAPQKALKDWLNHENARRNKLLENAGKVRAGTYMVPCANVKCKDCKVVASYRSVVPADLPSCPNCGSTNLGKVTKGEIEPTAEETQAILEEAKLYDDGAYGYKRANYSDVPADLMEPYAIEDVVLTRKISDVYEARLDQMPDLQKTYEFERQAMDALFAIEKRGLPAKQTEYRRLEQEVLDNLTVLEARVEELAAEADPVVYAKELAGAAWGKEGGPFVEVDESGMATTWRGGAARIEDFNSKSTPQILACLKARGADMSFMSEKNGKLSADAENLRAVDDDLAAAILEFRSEFKVLSTYVRPMIGRSYVSAMNVYKEPFIAEDSRIHATYRQVGARTGRMSCADPNMQNQPRDDLRLRYNIVADPGHVLVACDLSNIEMVLFAAYCGEGRLLNAVKAQEDLHVLTAKMLGLRDRKRPGGGIETARQLGKTYNFSRIYGGGLRTIKRSFRCSMDEARLLKRRFDDAYPEVSRLQNRIEYNLMDNGYIQDKLISGRRFRVDPRDAYKATNYLVQGTAASLLKYAVIKLHADGVPMVALVHDEIVAHVPENEAQDVAALVSKRMTEFEGLKGIVPLQAEADIIKRWSDAKPLKDEDGRAYYFDPEWANVERRYVDAA
jgi:DNA polymerase I-like protein with 3'-5' exonuclease and polymerase domains